MDIKLVCFDFDGTIADTMPWLERNAVNLFLEHHDMTREKAIHQYRITTGLPFEQQVELLFPRENSNKQMIEIFEKRKIERILEQELFPETLRVLQSIKEKGLLIAVSSSTTKEVIENYAINKGIHQYLDEIVGYYPGFEKGKLHFNFLMKKFDLNNNQLVYIGDSKKDMERADESGIVFIGRTGPMFSSRDFFLEKNNQKVFFKTITSLDDILLILFENM